MFRPMIYAPMPSPKRLAKSLSGPVVPPVFPFISRNARVPTYQPCSSSPPTPSGSLSPWPGPAPYPSSEIAKLWTRTLDMESSAGFICVEWAVPKSTGVEHPLTSDDHNVAHGRRARLRYRHEPPPAHDRGTAAANQSPQ